MRAVRLRRVARRVFGPARSAPAAPRPVPVTGLVEEFSRRMVSGWVSVPPGTTAVDVVLRVHGREIARTRAAAAAPERRDTRSDIKRFRFVLSHLWLYVGQKDAITVAVDGRRLPIAGHGMQYYSTTRGKKTVADLRAALDAGQVFSRSGRLQSPKDLDAAWGREVTGMAERVRRDVRERLGLEVFYTYGSLLGAIREGGFIGHDDDLDTGYLSAHTDPVEVGTEFYDVAVALVDAGWIVEPFGPVLHVFEEYEGGRRQRVDVFQHYFDDAGRLHVPWGMAGVRHVRREEWQGVHDMPFAGGTAPVPVAGEAVLAQLYGDDWREPQPGFSWAHDRTEQVREAEMPRELCDLAYWNNFYRRVSFDAPSAFQVEIAAGADLPRRVVDLGCGDGRDARAFADAGCSVLALDHSEAALVAFDAALGDAARSVESARCDVRDAKALRAVVDPFLAAAEPALFYLRFLVHGLTDDGLASLLSALSTVARPGDLVAAEFRTQADATLPKRHHCSTREYRDGAAVATQLQELGFVLESSDEAIGRSQYGAEDPVLWRLVARRTGD